MNIRWQDHIISNPEILKGKPVIKDTRIPVSLILGYLASGADYDAIKAEFNNDIKDGDIAACLDFARDLSEYEVAIS